MGESVVDAPKVDDQVGEFSMDLGDLHGSVSFGRFENDSLSWEKWSAFPAKKYLEEIEKFSTPGSVAQKKAYFEAHYNKIAARKAEQVDQEKQKDTDHPVGLQDQIQGGSVNNISLEETDDTKSDGHSTLNAVEIDNVKGEANGNAIAITANKVDLETEVINLRTNVTEVSDAFTVDPNNEADAACESEDLLPPVVDAKDVFSSSSSSSSARNFHLGNAEETVTVIEHAPSLDSQEAELPKDISTCSEATPISANEIRVDFKGLKKLEKVTTFKKATNIVSTKNKQSSPAARSPSVLTPKPLQPALSNPVTSTTRPPAESKNGFSPLTGKKTAPAASKRETSPALNVALSPGPALSDPGSLATTRRSLIMERMGDKDIIKRAFRTFQNNITHASSLSLEKSLPTYQLSGKETERKTLTSSASRASKEGMNGLVKKMHSLHGQQGTRRTPTSTGLSPKSVGSERSGTTVASSFCTKRDERADKLKGLSKKPGDKIDVKEAERTLLQSKMKPGDKFNAKEAERTLLNSKLKMQKDAEFKKLQQSFKFKAKPLPAFYRASGVAKSSADMKGAKTEVNC